MTTASVLTKTRSFSVIAVAIVVVLSLVFSLFFGQSSAPWQVWLAVGALAVGIPHGALDHVVTFPRMGVAQMAMFALAYVGVAALVVVAILVWPVGGFIFVVAMSAVHFGMGDASFVRQVGAQERARSAPWWVYAVPAGSLPIVIPLTNRGSTEALALVNPALVDWHFGADTALFGATVSAALLCLGWLVVRRRYADARDIVVLGLLALLTPPLVAFAAYFGLWHALRHTARLSQEMASAREIADRGQWVKALWRVSVPGLPALLGTVVVAAGITLVGGWALTDYLWVALAVVWALTVPHMALTWRLDQSALRDIGEHDSSLTRPPASAKRH
ncbi:MAG: Brp/Blh family beta-carotene 15,15'-monooxygenase [Pontimonas sp.]